MVALRLGSWRLLVLAVVPCGGPSRRWHCAPLQDSAPEFWSTDCLIVAHFTLATSLFGIAVRAFHDRSVAPGLTGLYWLTPSEITHRSRKASMKLFTRL